MMFSAGPAPTSLAPGTGIMWNSDAQTVHQNPQGVATCKYPSLSQQVLPTWYLYAGAGGILALGIVGFIFGRRSV